MSKPLWRDVRPSGPRGSKPEAGPRGRDTRAPANDPEPPRRDSRTSAPTLRMPTQPGPIEPLTTALGPDGPANSGGPAGAKESRGPRGPRGGQDSRRPRGLGWWGSLRGGVGVCIIFGSAALGAIATVLTRTQPGRALGASVVAGTVVAALAVRPRAGRLIFPVPVLSYLIAALGAGVAYDRSADSSQTALAIGVTQWIANGFFAMALATLLAVVLTAVRWYIWRRSRRAAAASGLSGSAAGTSRWPQAEPKEFGGSGVGEDAGGPEGWTGAESQRTQRPQPPQQDQRPQGPQGTQGQAQRPGPDQDQLPRPRPNRLPGPRPDRFPGPRPDQLPWPRPDQHPGPRPDQLSGPRPDQRPRPSPDQCSRPPSDRRSDQRPGPGPDQRRWPRPEPGSYNFSSGA